MHWSTQGRQSPLNSIRIPLSLPLSPPSLSFFPTPSFPSLSPFPSLPLEVGLLKSS